MDFQKNHYIAGTSNDAIRMIIPQGNIATNAGTPGTNNSVLVSDINNQRVRRVFLGVK